MTDTSINVSSVEFSQMEQYESVSQQALAGCRVSYIYLV